MFKKTSLVSIACGLFAVFVYPWMLLWFVGSTTTRKAWHKWKWNTYTWEEFARWWPAKCRCCGWRGLSRDCLGGEPIADTGDFNDPLCPECLSNKLDDDHRIRLTGCPEFETGSVGTRD